MKIRRPLSVWMPSGGFINFESIKEMSININMVIMTLVAVFICVACVDKLAGGVFGLGLLIDESFYTLGPLAVIMIGMITLSPVIARTLYPIVSPVLLLTGADPSLFVAAIMPSDSGGAYLALDICHAKEAGLFNGIIVASMMGASLGIIPLVLSATDQERHKYVILGLLIGFLTIPASALISGVIAGIDKDVLVYNLMPITVLAAMIAVALVYAQSYAVKVIKCLGHIVLCVAVSGFAASAVGALTGVKVIDGMAPINDAFAILGQIGVVLAGIFPMLYLVKKFFYRQMSLLATMMGVDDLALTGIITTLANFFPVIPMLNKMTNKGIVINMAFVVPAGYAIGDHLGFTAGFERSFVFPLVVGKISGGILAVMIASVYCKYIAMNE